MNEGVDVSMKVSCPAERAFSGRGDDVTCSRVQEGQEMGVSIVDMSEVGQVEMHPSSTIALLKLRYASKKEGNTTKSLRIFYWKQGHNLALAVLYVPLSFDSRLQGAECETLGVGRAG